MLKALDPFLPLSFGFKGYWLFCLLFLFLSLNFFRHFFSQALFFTAFSCFKNQFYDFSDPQQHFSFSSFFQEPTI